MIHKLKEKNLEEVPPTHTHTHTHTLPAPRYRCQTMPWVGAVVDAEDRRVAAERAARALLRAADEKL